jgi:outer membrane protein assembly factor BamE (lipoprotein component of BamABCDE complex)
MPPSPDIDPLDHGHPFLRIGMSRTQVLDRVGAPYFDDARGNLHYYSVSSRMHLRLRFVGDELVEIIHPE